MEKLITLLTVVLISSSMMGQSFQTIEEDELTTYAPKDNGILTVHNVNGPITIRGTDRSDILIKYELKVKPKSSSGLSQAKEDLSFVIGKMNDSVAVVLNSPFVSYYRGQRRTNIDSESMNYWFICTIDLEVPANINLNLATINEGKVLVENITGTVIADNVNGDVILDNVKGQVITETINGDIRVDFLGNPGDGSQFQTINGDIRTNVPDYLSAKVSFKSMNGEFYTDFDYTSNESGRLIKNEENKRGSQYKIEQMTEVTIGSGKSSLFYETLNGDMFLRKLN